MVSDVVHLPFGDLTENFDAMRLPVKQSQRRRGPYPYYGASGVVDHVDRYIFDGEYLLVAEDGENLRTRNTPIAFLARGKFWVNNHAHIVRGSGAADTRYLMYALLASDVRGYLTGSTMPKLTQANLNRLPVPAPPLPVQRAIAHILGTLDDKIDLNRRMAETLESIARAIFKSWFVDFDPVRANAEGRDTGLPKDIAELFPDRLVESAIGAVPEGWGVGPVLAHAALMSGGTPKTDQPDYWSGPIDWASAKDVSLADSSFLVGTQRTITERGLAESATQLIPALATVVIARGATTGRMVILGREMAMNQTCYALKSTVGAPFALFHQLLSMVAGFVQAAHGSVFDTITTRTFEGSLAVLPPDALQRRFDAVVSPLMLRSLSCVEESRTLATLRDTLLPKLISGELRVPEAMLQVEEATA
ncbi:MAG: restriction endonuclease subunit S [Planctomycetes bacterium]|nr:restriction endonuclease subunit S [Planctomycetota bacterium]MCB9829541.1 restriction endonuclease subunit S [Planctomycetota bacterium]